ncbi:MFS transporter [Paenibacillus sp. NEAU-GSW1]|uniref:MFS transporter n=1 Tax=Paenibacillus sp. NEAU-GSW1 TaxID=2682486 RepID=UPI0012E10DEC|nr:MFS transporter [Paenibacillus sp. NEAU-GSW1]MUT66497.1 MFS transporter [Paenibacillus sp. NEAU-GSW1]
MSALDTKRSTMALLALAISAFAIGTTEFISVGLLPLLSDDLHISIRTAGLTVTLYALGVTLGAPILTSAASRIKRKTLLLIIMAVFIAGNSLAAAADGIGLLLAARILSAFAHGVFMSIGSTIAADLVPEQRRASAIAIMFSGLTVATVTGVPFGTWLGQQLGWRVAFITIAIIGIVAFIANALLVPGSLRPGSARPVREQFKVIRSGRLLLSYAVTALGYGGTFVVFTYLSPLLHDVTGFSEQAIVVILLLYGIAIAIGNVIGGKLANRKPVQALFYMFAAQAAVLLLLFATASFKWLGLITILVMGLLAFMNVPGLQVYVVMLAERFAPKAVDTASAFNIAAFNAGIALGAYLGGIIADGIGVVHTAWAGALMVAAAVALTGWLRRLEKTDSLFATTSTSTSTTKEIIYDDNSTTFAGNNHSA